MQILLLPLFVLSTTLSFSQEVTCSADLQLHAPHWPEANKPHGKRLSHANREDGLCEDILVDKVVLGRVDELFVDSVVAQDSILELFKGSRTGLRKLRASGLRFSEFVNRV